MGLSGYNPTVSWERSVSSESVPEQIDLRSYIWVPKGYPLGIPLTSIKHHCFVLFCFVFFVFETWTTIWKNSEKLSKEQLCSVPLQRTMVAYFPSPILEYWDILNRWPQKSLWFNIWSHQWAMHREDRQGTFVGCLGAGSQMASHYITSFRRVHSVHLSFHHGHGEGRSWQTQSVTCTASEGAFVRVGWRESW